MPKNLAQELLGTVNRAEKRTQKALEEAGARRAGALAMRESAAADYAERKASEFIDALTRKLKEAAANRKTSASIFWTTGMETNALGILRAMEVTADHFQEQGLDTSIESYNNAHAGPAHGDLEERTYFHATEWTTTLTASVPANDS